MRDVITGVIGSGAHFPSRILWCWKTRPTVRYNNIIIFLPYYSFVLYCYFYFLHKRCPRHDADAIINLRGVLNAITTHSFSNSQFVPPFRLLPGSSYTTWNNSIRRPRPRPCFPPPPAILDPVAASTSLPRRQDLCVKGLLNCQRPRPSATECNGPTAEPLQGVFTRPEEHDDDRPDKISRLIFHRLYFSSLNEPNDLIFFSRNR